MFSYQVERYHQWHLIHNLMIYLPFEAGTQTPNQPECPHRGWDGFRRPMRSVTLLHCVLVLRQMHSMACEKCGKKVSYKEVCPGKMNLIFHHKNDHFSPSPSEYFLPTLPAGPLCGKELISELSCNTSRNYSCFTETGQHQVLHKWWILTISVPRSWIKDIFGVLPACYLFSAYQSDMKIYTLHVFVNLKARITKHFLRCSHQYQSWIGTPRTVTAVFWFVIECSMTRRYPYEQVKTH